MLTYKDVGLLDNSLDTLGQTLLRNRMMKQEQTRQAQEQQRLQQNAAAEQQYRNDELGLRGQQLSDEQVQRNILDQFAQQRIQQGNDKATQQDNELTKRLKQNTIEFHDKQVQEITDQVSKGVISPEQGTQMIKQGVSKWDDWEKSENPLYGQYSDPSFSLQAKPAKPPEAPKTTTSIKTGTEGGLPIDETNVTTTATSPTAVAAPQTTYKTTDDVAKAYKSGQLTRQQAASILQSQFGVQ